MRSYLIRAVVVVLTALSAGDAFACHEAMPDKEMIAKSDLIAVGEITRVRKVGFRDSRRNVATIKIGETLKGDKIRSVKLAFPVKRPGRMKSTDIFYQKGQEGIWFLRKPEGDDYYHADHPSRFQPTEKLDRYRMLIGGQQGDGKGDAVVRPRLDAWKKQVIDEWITRNDLNRYGDPKGTAYIGGTPLFNEKTGQYIDRYHYIYLKHPEVRKLLQEQPGMPAVPDHGPPAITGRMKKRIDAWIEENDLNRFGDPKNSRYFGGTPLFDERTGQRRDRYEYILENHPELRRALDQ